MTFNWNRFQLAEGAFMFEATPFDASRHPRGWHGRFLGGSNAHAMSDRGRPSPHPMKRSHAVVPHIKGMSRRSVGITGSVVRMPGD